MNREQKQKSARSCLSASIAYYRRARNLTTDELARKSGCSQIMIESIEKGKGDPSLAVLTRICSVLDVKLVELIDKAAELSVLGRCRTA